MEKEVLEKHRRALMLYGTMHLMHGQEKIPQQFMKRTIRG
jgi:hypothetical protein